MTLGCAGDDAEHTDPEQAGAAEQASHRADPDSRPAKKRLPRARCPAGLTGCRTAAGTILYVERVDPDGDGDAHFVLASRAAITAPGISVIDVRKDLRPHPLPGRGDRLSAAGPVQVGSHGQRQIEAVRVRVARSAMPLATIGVYGFTLDAFLAVLAEADVRLLLDVRQRRGVRGPEYAWANARRLQAALDEAGIAYRHHPELAPTTELRRLQYAEDDRQGVGKRSRTELAPEYRERYTAEILDRADLPSLVASLPASGAGALFCVERDPEACHRSLVADRIASEHGIPVIHLRPA